MTFRSYIAIPVSLAVALMLAMLPLPDWAIQARPDWVTLVMIYWAMALPANAGVLTAFIFGLLLDVSQGTLLGQHALGIVIVIFFIQKLHQRLRQYTLIQQAIFIGILLFIKQMLVLWVSGMSEQAPESSLYFLPAITGALIWPWLFILLRDVRRRFCRMQVT